MSTPTSPATVSLSFTRGPRCGPHRPVVDHAAAHADHVVTRVDAPPALDAGTDQRPSSGRSVGTAWRCMLAPISARFASSCSRNGTSDAATDTICIGATSMYWMRSGGISTRFAWFAARHQFVGQLAFASTPRWPGRSRTRLPRSPTGSRSVGHLAVDHLAVRRLEEAVFVGARTPPAS
jgi:hypothetical protein